MRKSTAKPRRKKAPKRSLALPDLEQSKTAVLSSLTSASGQRTYDHAIREFVTWYCSEPRLAFNRTAVLRYRIHLEQSKAAVLNSLTSASGQRPYDHAIREFVAWYCSEPRLAFNRTVVLRYRIHVEQRHHAPATINLRLAAVRRVEYEAQKLRRAVNDRLGIEPDAA